MKDIVASHHLYKGMKAEKEHIVKTPVPVVVEVVHISDRVKAKKKAKGEFAKGRYLGSFDSDSLAGRMNPPKRQA